MKKLSCLFLMSMLMFMGISFTSCSDDDDEGINNVSDLYGVWIPVYAEGYEKGGGEDDTWSNALNVANNYSGYSSIEFKEDATVKVYEYVSGTWRYEESMVYKVDGNKIYLDGDFNVFGRVLKLTNDEFIIESGEQETYEGVTYEYYEKVTYKKSK